MHFQFDHEKEQVVGVKVKHQEACDSKVTSLLWGNITWFVWCELHFYAHDAALHKEEFLTIADEISHLPATKS